MKLLLISSLGRCVGVFQKILKAGSVSVGLRLWKKKAGPDTPPSIFPWGSLRNWNTVVPLPRWGFLLSTSPQVSASSTSPVRLTQTENSSNLLVKRNPRRRTTPQVTTRKRKLLVHPPSDDHQRGAVLPFPTFLCT